MLNDTDLELSTSSSESESEASEASDEAGDLPHPARNNVPRFTLPLPYKSLFTQFLQRLPGCKLDGIIAMVLMGVLSGNILVMRIPITLTGYQAIIFRLRNPLIMKQPSKWHIKPVNCNILFYFCWNNISELIIMLNICTLAYNLGYLATPEQFFMGAKLFIGTP